MNTRRSQLAYSIGIASAVIVEVAMVVVVVMVLLLQTRLDTAGRASPVPLKSAHGGGDKRQARARQAGRDAVTGGTVV